MESVSGALDKLAITDMETDDGDGEINGNVLLQAPQNGNHSVAARVTPSLNNGTIVNDNGNEVQQMILMPPPPAPRASNGNNGIIQNGNEEAQAACSSRDITNGNVVTAVTDEELNNNGGDTLSLSMNLNGQAQAALVAVPQLPAPPLYCANGKDPSGCKEMGDMTVPCGRCHKEFYCSEEHRILNRSRHESDCKTMSKLERMHWDEEYSSWYKNAAPHLYDICLNFVLVWPSLTAQWYPDFIELENNVIRHKILLGTQTSGDMNHMLICGIDVHGKPDDLDSEAPVTPFVRYQGEMHILQRINHECEIHRARYMPQDPKVVATKSPSSEVYIFNCCESPEIPFDDVFRPTLRLRGHTQEGFGLAWSPVALGKVLSGSSDSVVCLWDVNATPMVDTDGAERVIKALTTLRGHSDVVEDVAWHQEIEYICASVGDDCKMLIWDLRCGTAAHALDNAHTMDINAVSFSPFSEFAIATASSDKTVGIWDSRNLKTKVHSLEWHNDEVMQVQWSPHDSTVLASTGKDGRVFMWNISHPLPKPETDTDSMNEEDEEGPRELSFIHGGHVTGINDISWNFHEIGMIASCSEDNVLQVWKVSDDLAPEPDNWDSQNDWEGEGEDADAEDDLDESLSMDDAD